MDIVPFLPLLLSIFGNGSFGVLHKLCRCSNSVFTLYYSVGLCLVSVATLPCLRAAGVSAPFSPWGLLSGLAQYVAIQFFFLTIPLAGLAISFALFGAAIIIISLAADTMLLGAHIGNATFLLLAMLLILGGLGGIAKSKLMSAAAIATDAAAVVTPPPPLHTHLLGDDDPEHDAALLAVNHAEPAAAPPTPPTPKSSSVRRGALVAFYVFMVSACFVANNFIAEEFAPSDVQGLPFVWSFGVGIAASALVLTPPLVWRDARRRGAAAVSRANLGAHRDALAGVASGIIWGVANIGVCAAIGLGVSLAVANALHQVSLVVAGLWGVCVFGEIQRPAPVALFFASSAMLLGGVILEGTAVG
jgi:glucose uptake protein GlcU